MQVMGLIRSRASYALADQVVYSFGNMVVAALLSRHCGAVQFGIYILTQRAMDVLIQLSNVFLWGPYTFHLPGMQNTRRARYQGSIVFLQLLFGILFTGLLYAASTETTTPRHSDLHAAFAPLVLASGGILFREFTRRMYFAHMRLKEAFWTECSTVLLQVAGVECLYRAEKLNVSNTLYVLSLSASFVSLWWIAREWKMWEVRLADVVSDFRRDLQLGRWFFGSNMVYLASAQCNPWVLDALLGGSSVGTYAISESLVNIPRVALTSMQNLMGPMLARASVEGGKPSVHRLVKRLNRTLLFVSLGFAAVIWLFGPSLARLIYHRTPAGTREIALWLSVNLVVYSCTLAQSYGLTALGRADAPFYANTFGLLVQASVCLFLIRAFHVPGAALAMLLGSLGVLVTRYWIYSREIQSHG